MSDITGGMMSNVTDNEMDRDLEAQALDDILKSKDKTESLIFQVNRLATDCAAQKLRQKNLTEDIKDSADLLGLKSATLKTFISAVENGDLDKLIQRGTSVVDVLEIIKGG